MSFFSDDKRHLDRLREIYGRVCDVACIGLFHARALPLSHVVAGELPWRQAVAVSEAAPGP
jgi:hypothetical protein